MKVLLQAIALLFILTRCSQAAQQIPERTITNDEIIESFEQLKLKATEKYSGMPRHEQAIARDLYDTTIYALNLSKHALHYITTLTKPIIPSVYEYLITKIQTNTAFAQLHPKLHTHIIDLYEKAYNQRIKQIPDEPKQRDVILFIFDICKDVVRTIGNQWGFDVRTALY